MPGPHKCPKCSSWRTVTHYHHEAIPPPPTAIPSHDFEILNSQPPPPPPSPQSVAPVPQPCPINGCYAAAPPPSGSPAFTYCLDCGNVEIHH
jgi:hypothetical protein